MCKITTFLNTKERKNYDSNIEDEKEKYYF